MGEQPRERDGRYGDKIEVGVAKRLTDALRQRLGHDGAQPADPADLAGRLAAQREIAVAVAERPIEVAIKADPLAEEVEVDGRACRDLYDVGIALGVDETKAAELVVTAQVDGASMAIIAESLEWLADETKRDFSTERRQDYADKGIALPDGSYPIPDKDALRRAIQSFGRGNTDKATVKRHIIKRARALDAVDMLPEDWKDFDADEFKLWPEEAGESQDIDGDEEKLFRRARGHTAKWDPSEHPRDAHGRFASVGATVKLPGGGEGKVVGTAPGGKIKVRRADGSEQTVNAKQTTVTRGPQATAAAEKPKAPEKPAAKPEAAKPAAPAKPERRTEEEHQANYDRLSSEALAAEKAGDAEKGKKLRNEALKERALMKAAVAESKPARGKASEHQANYERLAKEAEAAEKAGNMEKGTELRNQALAERARGKASVAENRVPRKLPPPKTRPGGGRTATELVAAGGGEAAAEDAASGPLPNDVDQMRDDLYDLDAGIVQRSNAVRRAGGNPKDDAKIKAWSKRSDQLEARLKRRQEELPGNITGAGGIGHTRDDIVANKARGDRQWNRLNALGLGNTEAGRRAYALSARERVRLNDMDAELAKPGKLDEKLVNYKPERDLADLSKTEPLAKMLPNAREVAYSKTPFIDELHRAMGIDDAETHDMKDYLARRDALFNQQPLQEVPFDNVVVTQPRVRGERVQQIRDHPETGGSKPQHFVRFNGETYVMNGHHRVAAQILNGDKGALGRVLDLDQHKPDDGINRGAWTGGLPPNGADGQGTRPDGSRWGTGYPDGDPRQDPAYDQYTDELDQKIDEKLNTIGDTETRFDKVDGVPKAYTPERRKMHDRILNDYMAKYADVPQEYKAIVMAGPPGAGKSTVIKTNGKDFGVIANEKGDPLNFATVNPDDLKADIVKYGGTPDDYFDTGVSTAEGASFVHEESSYLAEMLAAKLRAGGYNVLMDGTFAGKQNKQVAKVHTLRDAGYEVTGVLVDGTVAKSLQNARFRHTSQEGSPPATPGGPYRGRYVPIDHILSNEPPAGSGNSKVFGRPHRNASSVNIEQAQDAFDGGVIWYDNQTGESKKVKSTVPSSEQAAIRKMDALDRRIEAVSDEKVKEDLRKQLAALKQSFDYEYDSLALAWLRRGGFELETKVHDALADEYGDLLADEIETETKAGGVDKNRGNAERLRRYWTHGEGAASIRWGESGDHMRCVRQLVQHGKFRTDQAHGYCNLREKEATGRYPAQHAAASKAIDWLEGLVEVKATEVENVNPEPTGVMVALYPPDDVAAALSLETGVPAEELHVTLAYLGEVNGVGDRLDELVSIVAEFTDDSYDLSGEVSGLGRFSNTEDAAGDAFVALVDSPDLPDFRVDIVDALEDAGFEVRADHGFTPHMTLAYIDPDAKLPLSRLEPVPVTFTALSVAVGSDVWDFPLHPSDGTEDQHRSPATEGEGNAPYDRGHGDASV